MLHRRLMTVCSKILRDRPYLRLEVLVPLVVISAVVFLGICVYVGLRIRKAIQHRRDKQRDVELCGQSWCMNPPLEVAGDVQKVVTNDERKAVH